MFGMGMTELLIIGLVILVFVNPKDLPKFVYHVGRIYGQLTDAYQAMTRQIRDLGDEARREIERAKHAAEVPTPPLAPSTPAPTDETAHVAAVKEPGKRAAKKIPNLKKPVKRAKKK